MNRSEVNMESYMNQTAHRSEFKYHKSKDKKELNLGTDTLMLRLWCCRKGADVFMMLKTCCQLYFL